MEEFVIAAVVCVLLASPVLALLAFLHSRRVEREIDERLRLIEQRLASTQSPAVQPRSETTPVSPPTPKPAHRPTTLARPTAPTPPPIPDPVPPQVPAGRVAAHQGTAPVPMEDDEPPSKIDWERWLGIRGAAVGGAIALAIAGLLFLQHAVQQGWFGPTARIISGAALGAILMTSRGRLARFAHPLLADVLVGAGAVLEYGAAWAAWRLFDLVPMAVAFPWMLAATVGTCFLALRHSSSTIATFGLVGGFATPLLLGTDPSGLGLFAYLLLLDLALITIARKGRWKALGPLALVGTAILQAHWLLVNVTVETAGLGLLYLATFAVLFMVRPGVGDRALDAASRLAALGIAALMASVLALRSDLGVSLAALGPFLGILTLGACAASFIKEARGIVSIAAGADAILGAAWLLRNLGSEHPSGLWAWTGMMLAFAVLFALYARLNPEHEGEFAGEPPETPFCILTLGVLPTLAWASGEGEVLALGPMTLAAAGLLSLVGLLLADRVARLGLSILAGVIGILFAQRSVVAVHHDPALSSEHLPQVVGLALGLLVLAWFLRGRVRQAPLAAAVLLVPVILALAPPPGSTAAYPLALMTLALLATASSTWYGKAWAHGVLVAAVVLAEQRWFQIALDPSQAGTAGPALAWAAGFMGLVTLGPLCAGRRIWRGGGAIGRAVLLAPVVWLRQDLWQLRETALPGLSPAAVPLALATVSALALTVVLLQHRAHPRDPNLAKARVFAAAVTAGLLALGVARWIGPMWGTVAAALAGLAWTALGVKNAHDTLRTIGLVVLAGAGMAVLVTTVIPYTHPLTDALIWNRISYCFFVPLAAIAGGIALFQRDRGAKQTPLAERVLGPLVVLGVFAWLNVLIVQATTEGAYVVFELRRITGRDLAMSLGWIVYSLTLLGLGTAGRISGLRWMSLGITLLTVGKVFLYDLGNLRGMYRVGSLAGLAMCLLIVSYLYQQFVFRRPDAAEPTG